MKFVARQSSKKAKSWVFKFDENNKDQLEGLFKSRGKGFTARVLDGQSFMVSNLQINECVYFLTGLGWEVELYNAGSVKPDLYNKQNRKISQMDEIILKLNKILNHFEAKEVL